MQAVSEMLRERNFYMNDAKISKRADEKALALGILEFNHWRKSVDAKFSQRAAVSWWFYVINQARDSLNKRRI